MKYAFIDPYYAVTADLSDKPYSVEASVPGHFKGYGQTPVIGENKLVIIQVPSKIYQNFSQFY